MRAKDLLSQALSVAINSLPNDRSVLEAKSHMKKALSELDKATKRQVQRKVATNNQFENWWSNVNNGVSSLANQPMSAEAGVKSLKQLNAMIADEQKKIDEIELKSQQNKADNLLTE